MGDPLHQEFVGVKPKIPVDYRDGQKFQLEHRIGFGGRDSRHGDGDQGGGGRGDVAQKRASAKFHSAT